MKQRSFFIRAMIGVLVSTLPASATIINIPDDYPTIQEGINASVDGDTVMVAPGIYTGIGNREISTAGKAIVVMGKEGAINTIIDGEGLYTGFIIANEEQSATVIRGFTIRNVTSGIFCNRTYPTVSSNIFENFLSQGVHVEGYLSDPLIAPVIEDCIFSQEDQDFVGRGRGIYVFRSAEITISGCKFSNCLYGLEFYASGDMWPIFQIADCVIRDNASNGIWTHS